MQALPSAQQGYSFSKVPQAHIQRSSFDRSHTRKMTFSSGNLVPFYRDLMLPGDTFNLNATFLARLSSTALTKPVMDNIYLETFFFFCPIRLVWLNFRKMMGEQDNPADSTSFIFPTIPTPAGGVVTGSLTNHLGVPYFAATKNINSVWHRMYNLTWNQWFRDENLQNSVVVDTDDGPDTYTDYVLLNRGKRHDYFTSCLPSPQKGTAISLPLGTSATVKTNATNLVTGAQSVMKFIQSSGSAITTGRTLVSGASDAMFESGTALASIGTGLYPSNLYADLSTATSATINALRQSIALQQMLEIDARSGTRYTEVIRAHFGVFPAGGDARLQRVEFLGSGQTHININPVAGTNNVGTGATAAGQLTAFGQAAGGGHGFTYSATEHGLLLGLVCVRADLTYQQGINRDFFISTKYDLYWPSLSNIGEEAVLNQEIYADGSANDTLVFGYQERYASFRYKPSEITGNFTSNPSGGVSSLEAWHLAQDFAALPTLGTTFIQESPPLARIKAVTTEPDWLCDVFIRLHCARPMPLYAVPGLTRL